MQTTNQIVLQLSCEYYVFKKFLIITTYVYVNFPNISVTPSVIYSIKA